MYEFINLIKTLAALLVVNSHFDAIWPKSALATGGSIGNCLFFVSTGFLLANIRLKFGPWYLKKIARIYPGVIIVESVALLFLNANTDVGGQYGLLSRYLICGGFWFLQALICIYIPYYVIMVTKLREHLVVIGILVIILYIICYLFFVDKTIWSIESTRFKWIFYFGIMVMGGGYALRIRQQRKILDYHFASLISITMLIVFYGLKFILDKYPQVMPMQFIEHIVLAIFIYALMAVLIHYEGKFKVLSKKAWWMPIEFLSRITLEIYLVMDFIINRVETLSFPVSLVLACVLISVFAWILYIISKRISDPFVKLIK